MSRPVVIKDPSGAVITLVIYPLKNKETSNKLISEIETMVKKDTQAKKAGPNKPNED